MAELVKQPIVLEEELVEANLAVKASAILGYDVLKTALRVAGPLGKILRELEIVPFSSTSVAIYQEEKLKIVKPWWKIYSDWEWLYTPLYSYDQPVPEFVLHKAIQIKEKARAQGISRHLELTVCHLTNEVKYADPFLYVGYLREGYYVEVWDEPKFENLV